MPNLKVLHLLSSPSAGGAEVFVKDMVLNSQRYGIDAGILFISSAENVGRASSYEKGFLFELKQENIPFFILPKNARRNIFHGYLTFKACIKEFLPDGIHSHLLMGIVYSALFCRRIPLIYTHHNSIIQTKPFIFRTLMACCNAHIGISKICAKFLQQYLLEQDKCTVIYNAIDNERLCAPEKNSNTAKHKLTLIAVGAISTQKNYLYMLEAVVTVKKVLANIFHLKIAGEGKLNEEKEILDYINTNDLSDTVELLGNRSDVPQLLVQSDVFLMSSAWEGLPIALIEAQLSGVPSLVTDVGGCKELLAITKGGIVVPVHDREKYANALEELICNAELRNSLSISALNNVSYFSIEYCLKKHKALYQKHISIQKVHHNEL